MELPKLQDWPTALHGLAISVALLSIALCLGPPGHARPEVEPEVEPPSLRSSPVEAEPEPSTEDSERIVIGLSPSPSAEPAPSPVAIARVEPERVEPPSVAPERAEPPPRRAVPSPPPRHRRAGARTEASESVITDIAAPEPSPANQAQRERVNRALAERGLDRADAERLPAVAAAMIDTTPGADPVTLVLSALDRTTLPDELLKRKLDGFGRELSSGASTLSKERVDRFEENYLELKTTFGPALGRDARQRLLKDITAARRALARAIEQSR